MCVVTNYQLMSKHQNLLIVHQALPVTKVIPHPSSSFSSPSPVEVPAYSPSVTGQDAGVSWYLMEE